MERDPALVVFSHLRWAFVYQRPQQVLSRLATDRRVLFIEEPTHVADAEPQWRKSSPAPNVTVCQPCTPIDKSGFTDAQLQVLRPMLDELLAEENVPRYVTWFYTPMAQPLASALSPEAIVYDCMDELASFAHAPAALRAREQALLKQADVVFTGGPSLYRAKLARHPNVHCLPSSVDAAHFARAREIDGNPDDQAAIPRPRLGFFGVIDERLDRELLGELARARPDWQIVMVGPVVKIDPATLPKAPNLHYLGAKPYEALPAYLAGWDVCLLPFARNEATRYISPTKTLEYMAALKPIVSTPITDVAEPYGEIVYLGGTADEFVSACERALEVDAEERADRAARMEQVLARTSWDATVRTMRERIERAIDRRRHRQAQAAPAGAERRDRAHDTTSGAASTTRPNSPRAAASTSTTFSGTSSASTTADADEQHELVVIGAGPTGLSCAYHHGPGSLLLERHDRVGGCCRSVYDSGFTFDLAGHIMFSKDPYVHELYETLLGDNVHWQDREAWIYSKGVYTRYPFQGCLYGLPPDVIAECLLGAIEARFGPLKPEAKLDDRVAEAAQRNASGSTEREEASSRGNGCRTPRDTARRDEAGADDAEITDCCADGIMESEVELVDADKVGSSSHATTGTDGEDDEGAAATSENFESFIDRVWGRGIARHFAIAYNRKLWAVDLKEMETSWLGGRVPMPDLEQMVINALQPPAKPMGPNARFGYPLRGGFQALMDGFVPHVRDRLRLNTPVVRISPRRRTVTTRDGRQIAYDHLVSTMPLPVLIRMMGDEAPQDVRRAAAALRYVSVRCVNIGVGRENLTDKHWIYYPEDTVFHRIFVQGNASPHCNPPGGFGLTCEITYAPSKPLPAEGDALIQRCIEDCHRVGIFSPDDPVWTAHQTDLPYAYVVYDHDRPRHVALIRRWLAQQNIILAGRYSEWEYYNSDHAFIAGKRAADQVRQLRRAAAASGVRG